MNQYNAVAPERQGPVMVQPPSNHSGVGVTRQSGPLPPPIGMSFEQMRMICPYCGVEIITNVTYEVSGLTWALSIALGCCLCWLPYICDSAKDVQHECPSCFRSIGHAKRC